LNHFAKVVNSDGYIVGNLVILSANLGLTTSDVVPTQQALDKLRLFYYKPSEMKEMFVKCAGSPMFYTDKARRFTLFQFAKPVEMEGGPMSFNNYYDTDSYSKYNVISVSREYPRPV
jgi:hypothetical protein